MDKVKISITGENGKGNFDINLKVTSFFGLDGNWSCLPGYLKATSGYFEHVSSYNYLRFCDREMGIGEMFSYAFSDGPSPVKLFMSLEDFNDSPAVGNSGKGHIFLAGETTKKTFLDKFGFATSDIIWKVKQVV